MAATLKARIESYVGTQSDTVALDEWIAAACRWLTFLIPEKEAEQFATTTAVTSGTTSVSNKRLIAVIQAGNRALQAAPWQVGALADSGSIYYPTARSPRYYIADGGKLTVLPAGSPSMLTLEIPVPTNSSTSIAVFPIRLEQAVVLYCAIQARLKQIDTLQATTAALTWTLAVGPTPPTDPSFTYTDAVVGTISQAQIDPLSAPPVYTAPSIAGWPTTLVGAVDVSAITPPAEPAAPTYSYADPIGGIITPTVIASFITAPVFNAPASPVSYVNPVASISTDEDIEKGQAELQIIQTQLAEYKTNIDNALGDFNEAKVAYEADVQLKIHQADLDQQRLVEAARNATDLNSKIEAQTAATAAQLYQSTLEKFQGDLKRYTDRVDAAVKAKQVELSNLQIDRSTLVQRFQADIDNASKAYEQTVVVYQATLQRAIQQAQLDLSRLSKVADLTTDANLRNAQQQVTEQVAQYQASLERYSKSVEDYAGDIQQETQRFQSTITRNAENLKELDNSVASLRGELQTLLAPFQQQQQNAGEEDGKSS